jgi:hypothetical protein
MQPTSPVPTTTTTTADVDSPLDPPATESAPTTPAPPLPLPQPGTRTPRRTTRSHQSLPTPNTSAHDVTVANHPTSRRNYRVATAAIQEFVDLVDQCVRVMIPGALVHARPRMGKTHAIEYICLHLARQRPDLLVLRLSCEHHRSAHEGPFFSALLAAVGVRYPTHRSGLR